MARVVWPPCSIPGRSKRCTDCPDHFPVLASASCGPGVPGFALLRERTRDFANSSSFFAGPRERAALSNPSTTSQAQARASIMLGGPRPMEVYMKSYLTKNIRNVGIVGHGGTGKTQLVSSLLHTAVMTPRWGKLAEGTAVTDWEEEEIARKISFHTRPPYAQ